MTPKQMLKTPVAQRRGTVTQESGSYAYLLVSASPDDVLDALLASNTIGAARRDCLKDLRENAVPRPVGPWGMLVRLKGHPWTYVLADSPRYEWPKDWAARHNWRVAWFSLDGMVNTKIARLYDGPRELFNFTAGLLDQPEPGFLFRKDLDDESAQLRGESADVCSQSWLDQRKSGGEAIDQLARFADAYLPVSLHHGDEDGRATVGGWDGDPHPDDDDEYQNLPDDAFERLDVFTFGRADTLEPSPAALALGRAVRAGDAQAARAALAAGADPNVMPDDKQSPLTVALGLGSPYLTGGRFATVSLQQQLALMSALLEAGANPDLPGQEPAIHRAIHWADRGDEQDILAQLRLLLDHRADPNALGSDLRSAGQRPLHVVAQFHQWLAVLKLLVSRGADAKFTNHNGETPRQRAEWRLNYLNESLAKYPAPTPSPDAPADGLPSAVAAFAKLLTRTDDDTSAPDPKQTLAQLFGNVARQASADHRAEIDRLNAVISFLSSAEQGKADLSDIDALAAASHQQFTEAQKEHEAQKLAALSHLQSAQKSLFETFKTLKSDPNP